MFYWLKRNSGGSDTLHNMSKSEILRGIVTEKLTTAAQEILAVVERTVTGYEEEAAALRTELDRQKRQLEVLLQPQVKLERREAMNPGLEGHDVVVLSEEDEEQQQHKQQPGVEDTGSLGLMWYDDDDDDDEDDEQQAAEQLATSARQKREDLKDPDFEVKSKVISPRARSDRRRPGRPQISNTQSHLDLRICILEDSQTEVLSNSVFQKCPVQELQCPRGLQEAGFLDLLRSTFPQLDPQKPLDFFTTDRTKRLQRLRVETLTPEEVLRSIRLTGAGNSALYIRLKSGEDPQSSSEDLLPLERRDESPSNCAATSTDQTQTHSRLSSPRAPSDRRRRGRPRLGEEPTHHFLKICMLEDSQSDVLSNKVLLKSSIQDLRCPRGIKEADFLQLLKSTFPQLAGDDKPFNIFKSDRSRRLQRLKVKTLTPEEIYRTMKSTGVEKTLLYIRLKTGEEKEDEEEEEKRENEDSAVERDEALLSSSSSETQQQHSEPQEDDDEDVAEGQLGSGVGDHDWKPDPERRRRGRGGRRPAEEELTGGSKMPCKICGVWYKIQGSLIKHAWSHAEDPECVCGVCGGRFQSVEELKGHIRSYQKTHDCSYCGKSFLTVTGLNCHTTLHTGNRPFKCDVCSKFFARMSSLSVHRWVHVDDKPHKCDVCPKAFGLKAQLRAHRKVHNGRDAYHCNVCGKSTYDLRSLTRHKATHSGERRYGCEVCGKRFKLSSTLKSHEKIHTARERPYLCHVCCKTFMTNASLTAHMKTHSSERPFACSVCRKGFISNGERKAHMRVHTDEAPYSCSQCGRCFKRKTHLNNHVRSHLGIKLFVCGVCGKACSRQEHLTVHMRTHNGERPYQCSVCDKAFTQSHCLKTHMKSHQGADDGVLQQPAP